MGILYELSTSLEPQLSWAPRLIMVRGEAACHNPSSAVGTAIESLIFRGALSKLLESPYVPCAAVEIYPPAQVSVLAIFESATV